MLHYSAGALTQHTWSFKCVKVVNGKAGQRPSRGSLVSDSWRRGLTPKLGPDVHHEEEEQDGAADVEDRGQELPEGIS